MLNKLFLIFFDMWIAIQEIEKQHADQMQDLQDKLKQQRGHLQQLRDQKDQEIAQMQDTITVSSQCSLLFRIHRL